MEKKTKDTEAKASSDEIIVNNPLELRPIELPLVVVLPESASKAQIAYAVILNSYAYQNPQKWERKKGALIEHLKSLKTAPDPVTEENLSLGRKLAK